MTPETIRKIDNQLLEWKAGQPLSKSARSLLHSKQDMLWSFNSNHLEGNTLSYGETELLLLHGEVSGNHSIRDVDEMRAHHVAVNLVRQWAQEDRDITEADIRNINKILLKEPFTKATVTEEGLPASRLITPGVYKREPNHVKTKSGDLFHFAEPVDVPARMEMFTENLRESLPDNAFDIAVRLARLHHEFILIHPFDDGNGRTVRLLLNYVLLRDGLPAIIIKSEEKVQYLQALRLADAGECEALVEFLLRCMEYALDLGVKSIRGESLYELDDTDMKLSLLKKRLRVREMPAIASVEQQWEFCRNYILPYFTQFTLKFAQKDEMFARNERYLYLEQQQNSLVCNHPSDLRSCINQEEWRSRSLEEMVIIDSGKGFLRGDKKGFDTIISTKFLFDPFMVIRDGTPLPYDSLLTESEAKLLVNRKLEELIADIELKSR